MGRFIPILNPIKSPSSRRAWIEITFDLSAPKIDSVALLAEGVDRNRVVRKLRSAEDVALLAEGVDRNNALSSGGLSLKTVALLAEGVDRNLDTMHLPGKPFSRPPRGGRG